MLTALNNWTLNTGGCTPELCRMYFVWGLVKLHWISWKNLKKIIMLSLYRFRIRIAGERIVNVHTWNKGCSALSTNVSYWQAFEKPLLPWKSNKCYIFWVCFYSLPYPACKEHATFYIVICGLFGCTTFSTLPHKRHDVKKMLLNIKLSILI